jgi:3-oxoadipate enol-lactonase
MSTLLENLKIKYENDKLFRNRDGTETYYEMYGCGSNLTIVNNFFIISPIWKNFTKELSKKNLILTYDLRNQGASTPSFSKINFSSYVEDLKELLDGLGITSTYLLGSSTSTLICRDFAIAYPEMVKGLVLTSPLFCPYGTKRRRYLTKSWINTLEKSGVKGLFEHIYPLVYSDRTIENGGTPAYLSLKERFLALNSYEQVKYSLDASLETNDDPIKLKQIMSPTLLLAGEADFLTCKSSLEASSKLIDNSQVEILDYSGHIPYFEATTNFELVIQKFIDSIEGKGNDANS